MRRILYPFLSFSFALICSTFQAQVYDFNSETPGSSGTLTNGWTCTPSTGFYWQAESGASPGNTSAGPSGAFAGSNYMVTNSSSTSTNAAQLVSPAVDITGYTNPGFGFWYYMNGASYTELTVEASTDGVNWTTIDTIMPIAHKDQDSRWKYKRLDLSGFSSTTTQVQFNTTGTPHGGLGPIAIDLCSFVEMPAEDAGFDSVGINYPYTMIPLSQVDSIVATANITNYGSDTMNNVSYTSTLNTSSGPVTLTSGTNSLNPGETGFMSSTNNYTPTGADSIGLEYIIDPNPSDTFSLNDTMDYHFEVTDSIYARERGNFTGGIGFNAPEGQFGQKFTIYHTDTLTAVRVRLQGPTAGDSVRFYLFDMSSGVPTTLLDSSDYLEIPSNAEGWYTVNFTCEAELTPGDYFFSAKQINANNLSFGYSQDNYEPNTCFYRVDDASPWTPIGAAGFQIALGIRPVFGIPKGNSFSVDLGSDTSLCGGGMLDDTLDAYVFGATYQWSTNNTTPTYNVTSTDTYSVTVSKCGVQETDTIVYDSLPMPDVDMGGNETYCEGENFSRNVSFNTTSASYLWHDGSSGPTYSIDTAGTYSVTADLNGCEDSSEVVITEEPLLEPVDLGHDTGFCEGTPFSLGLFAGNFGADHSWSNGSSTSNIVANSGGTYSVTVTQGGACPDTVIDTIVITEAEYPDTLLENIAVCEDDLPVTLSADTGFPSYNWSTGETTESIQVSDSGAYFVTISNDYNCVTEDSAEVMIHPNPVVDLGPDIEDTNTVVVLDIPGVFDDQFWSVNETGTSITVEESGVYWVRVTDSNGCEGSDTVRVDIYEVDTTSVGEFEAPQVNVYPNPARNHIYIESTGTSGDYEIKLFNAAGTLVRSQRFLFNESTRTKIDVSNLSSGLYLLQLSNGNEQNMIKVIID